jgi:hypothetical protein
VNILISVVQKTGSELLYVWGTQFRQMEARSALLRC